MKKILWISRYDISYKQTKDLEIIFKDEIMVSQEKNNLTLEEIIEKSKDYDALAVVLPISMISEIKEHITIPIFRSVMKRIDNNGKPMLTHDYWEEIKEIKLIVEKYDFNN